MKKVLFLLNNPFTHDNRVLKECASLIRDGYSVELWAKWREDLPEYETINGILIKRIFSKPKIFTQGLKKKFKTKKNNPLFKPYYYFRELQIVFNKYKHFRRILNGKKSSYETDADIIHCNDLEPLPLAVSIKNKYPSVKIVYDAHEYETETSKFLKRPLAKRLAKTTEKKLIKYADAVITVSESIADKYKRLYGIKKPDVVLNIPTGKSPGETSVDKEYYRRVFNIDKDSIVYGYSGHIKSTRYLRELCQVFSDLENDKYHLVIQSGVRGDIIEEVKEYCRRYSNIHYNEPVPVDEVVDYVSGFDVGISFSPTDVLNGIYSLPNKFFQYLHAGVPVLSNEEAIERKRYISQYDIGWIVPRDKEQIKQMIKNISQDDIDIKRDNVRKNIKEFTWEAEKNKLVTLYSRILTNKNG